MKDDVSNPFQVISVCGKVGKLEEAMTPIIKWTCCDDNNPEKKDSNPEKEDGNPEKEDSNPEKKDSNQEICSKQFRFRAWVKLVKKKDRLNSVKFVQDLLDQFCTNYCPRHGTAEDFLKLKGLKMVNEEKLMEEFMKQVMKSQRYLVFLEAVSSEDDWHALKKFLPDKTDGSCIVVHTEDPKVGSLCVGQPDRELEVLLSADHSVHVFFKKVTIPKHHQ